MLGQTTLGHRQQAQLVRLGRTLLLIGVSPAGAETLAEVTDASEVDRLAALCRGPNAASTGPSFRDVLQNFKDRTSAARTSKTQPNLGLLGTLGRRRAMSSFRLHVQISLGRRFPVRWRRRYVHRTDDCRFACLAATGRRSRRAQRAGELGTARGSAGWACRLDEPRGVKLFDPSHAFAGGDESRAGRAVDDHVLRKDRGGAQPVAASHRRAVAAESGDDVDCACS